MKTIQFVLALTMSLMFTMPSCVKRHSCENTMCMNGGVCTSGTCDCPERFTGPNCQEQKVPGKILLLGISVTRFPALNENVQWDAIDGPDIFFRLLDEDGPLTQSLTLIENANAGMTHMFSINTMDLFNISQVYTLKLLDYEGAGILSEDMGKIEFQLYQDANGFPEKIVVDDGGPLAFTLHVQYL